MEYRFEEYDRVIDTPKKKLEERTVVEKIISLLNNKKYNSLDDFCKDNSDFETFKKNNNLENVLKHFGNKLNQTEYENIIQSLKKMIAKKSTFDTNEIKKENIDNKEYIVYNDQDENYFMNNSYSNKSLENEMEDLQKEFSAFQTTDPKENTKSILKEMNEKKKISLILRYLNEINFEILPKEQQDLFKFAFEYQQKNPGLIRVDLDECVMVDEDNNIMKIDKKDDNYTISDANQDYNKPEEEQIDLDIEKPEEKEEKTKNLNLMKKTQLFS